MTNKTFPASLRLTNYRGAELEVMGSGDGKGEFLYIGVMDGKECCGMVLCGVDDMKALSEWLNNYIALLESKES